MLRQTALLIVSNPKQIGQTIHNARKQVKNTLYIQLLPAITEPFGNFYPKYFNTWPKLSHAVFNIYSQVISKYLFKTLIYLFYFRQQDIVTTWM